VEELAHEIDEYYSGREVVVVVVLRGAFIFASDLVRRIQTPILIDFICLESYHDGICSSGNVRVASDMRMPVKDRHVLIIEDIVDTGYSADFLINHLYEAGASDVRLCALLDKPSRREMEVDIHFLGFTVPDAFVVGYGIDHAQRYRNLPDIRTIEISDH